jgi:hypothetical protein
MGYIALLPLLRVVVLAHYPWLGCCCYAVACDIVSKNEKLSENNTAVTKIQPSAESHDVGRDALLPPSTIDARRTKVK